MLAFRSEELVQSEVEAELADVGFCDPVSAEKGGLKARAEVAQAVPQDREVLIAIGDPYPP
jgi:hypothetical protein